MVILDHSKCYFTKTGGATCEISLSHPHSNELIHAVQWAPPPKSTIGNSSLLPSSSHLKKEQGLCHILESNSYLEKETYLSALICFVMHFPSSCCQHSGKTEKSVPDFMDIFTFKRSPLLIPSRTTFDEAWIPLQHKQLNSKQFGIKAKRFLWVRLKLSKIWTFCKKCFSLHTDKKTCRPTHISAQSLQMLQGEWNIWQKKIYIFLTKLFTYQVNQGWNSTEEWKLYISSWLL